MPVSLVDAYSLIAAISVILAWVFLMDFRRGRMFALGLAIFFVVFGVWMYSRPSIRWVDVYEGILVDAISVGRDPHSNFSFWFDDGHVENMTGRLFNDLSSYPLHLDRRNLSVVLRYRSFDSMVKIDVLGVAG